MDMVNAQVLKIIESLIVVVKVLKLFLLQIRLVNFRSIKNVTDEDDLMIINKSGIAIRMSVEDLRGWEELPKV